MKLADHLEQIALDHFTLAFRHGPYPSGCFRHVIMSDVSGESKPILIVGRTHASHGDGRITAILNPDENLLGAISPSVGYTSGILKEMVAKRCDCMVGLWVNGADSAPRISSRFRYEAKKPSPPKFKAH